MKTLFQSFSPYLTGVAATTVVFSFSSCKKENKVPPRYNIVYIMTLAISKLLTWIELLGTEFGSRIVL